MQDPPFLKKTESDYFETELNYLIAGGKKFAQKHPAIASNLQLTQDGSDDPHVQQILESFSFLTGNLQKQIDQNSSILSRTLLENLYPNLVYPIPCMSINEFEVNSSHPDLCQGVVIPRESLLVHNSNQEIIYKFKTIFDTLLFPGDIKSVHIESALNYDFIRDKNKKILSIEIELFSGNINKNSVKDIRFYINAGKFSSNKIFDLIFTDCQELYIYNESEIIVNIPKESISKVGFYDEESLIYIRNKNPENFKILQEYFLYAEKFLFFELKNLDFNKIDHKFKIIFVFNNFSGLNLNLDINSFKLRCTPIINLFPVMSEPVITEKFKKNYKLYTNYLKDKFVSFHSIDKLKYLDENNISIEIESVNNYTIYLQRNDKNYFYEINSSKDENNLFEIKIYENNKNIFLDEITIYADIFVSNGNICEKLRGGLELNSIENYPINKGVLLKSPSKYLEGINDVDFYWRAISCLYTEKLNFTDLNEFLSDLKSIISLNLEIVVEKERGYSILNAIEDVKINDKLFKFKNEKSYSFYKGKEINLYVNLSLIINESYVILSECIFSFLKNIFHINQCVSLILLDSNSKRILYSCLPKKGLKKAI